MTLDDNSSAEHRSAKARRRFTFVVVGLLAAYAVVQIVAPPLLVVAAIVVAFTGEVETNTAELMRGTVWKGSLWHFERSGSVSVESNDTWKLCRLPLQRGARPEVVAKLPQLDNPWLLGTGDRLWLVANNQLGYVDDSERGDVVFVELGQRVVPLSNPFLIDGALHVYARVDGTTCLAEYRPDAGRWVEWDVPYDLFDELHARPAGEITAINTSTGNMVFVEGFDNVQVLSPGRVRTGSDLVLPLGDEWTATAVDGQAVYVGLFQRPFGYQIHAMIFNDYGGRELVSHMIETPETATVVAAYPLPGDGGFLVASDLGLFQPVAFEVRDGTVVKEYAFSEMRRLPPLPVWIAGGGLLLTRLLVIPVVWLLSMAIRRRRDPAYFYNRVNVPYAGLLRRCLAKAIDQAIVSIPFIAAGLWVLYRSIPLEELTRPEASSNLRLTLILLASLSFIVLCLMSVVEGRFGTSPGKQIFSLRVVGTDLAPCGIGRALGRNLLLAVDGMLDFTVGLATIAFSPDRRRVGDLAARTLVLDSRQVRLPLRFRI